MEIRELGGRVLTVKYFLLILIVEKVLDSEIYFTSIHYRIL